MKAGPTPVYANGCKLWVFKGCYGMEFVTKIGKKTEGATTVFMTPETFERIFYAMFSIVEGETEEHVGIPEKKEYNGVEFA